MAVKPPTPLIRYLRVQEHFERSLLIELTRSQSNIDAVLRTMVKDDRIGATIRRAQLREVQREIKKEMARLWRLVGSQVMADRALASAAAVESLAATYVPMLTAAGMSASAIDVLIRSQKATAARGIANVATRMNLSKIPLSERVYKSGALVSGRIDRLVNDHIARGSSARDIAKDVRQFIDPHVKGGVRYAAQRLGRTELNNAFHGTQVQEGIKNPMITVMRWNLSGSHPRPDECNDYETGGDLEDGLWSPGAVPGKPHPQCLCFMTAETPSRAEFIRNFRSGEYDSYLDKVIAGG